MAITLTESALLIFFATQGLKIAGMGRGLNQTLVLSLALKTSQPRQPHSEAIKLGQVF